MKIERELKSYSKYNLISFDIFDTLIVRSVNNPKDVFYYAGSQVLLKQSEALLFQKRRIEAETVARQKSKTGEVNLKNIYSELYKYYGIKAGILKESEERLELQVCKPRNKWVSLFNAYVREGKKVILISDMYLPSSHIKKILSSCGIIGFAGLYISNEYGCDKVSGNLYKIVQERELCFDGLHLHYGDSFRADYLGARKANVTPRFVFKERWLYKLYHKLI